MDTFFVILFLFIYYGLLEKLLGLGVGREEEEEEEWILGEMNVYLAPPHLDVLILDVEETIGLSIYLAHLYARAPQQHNTLPRQLTSRRRQTRDRKEAGSFIIQIPALYYSPFTH